MPTGPEAGTKCSATGSPRRRSPILSTLDRESPPFVWRGAALGLLQSDPGLTLAYRVVDWQEHKARAAEIARRAGQELERVEDRAVALEFADGIESRARAMAQRDD